LQLLQKFMGLVFCCSVVGCATPGQKFLDSPEVKAALVQMVSESQKQWRYGARLANPEIQLLYCQGFQARIIGLSGELGIEGSTPGQIQTRGQSEPTPLNARQ